MNQKKKDTIVNQIDCIVISIVKAKEDRVFEFMHRMIVSEGVQFDLTSEASDKYDQLCRQLLQKERWDKKFSEKYLDDSLQKLIARVLREGKTDNVRYYFEELLDKFNNYSQEHAVYIPLDYIQMYEVDTLKIGRIFLERMTSSKIEELTTRMKSIVERTRRTSEEKAFIIQEYLLDVENLREKVCSELHIIAEPVRAREFAEEETRRVLDLLRYSIPALYRVDRNISISLQGEVSRGVRTGIILSTDSSSFKFDSRRVGSIGNFDLSKKHIEIMENVGVFELSKMLEKQIECLTDFEETILRGVYWFSNAQTQSERENKFLSLVTCLEIFLTPKDRDPIANSIAEGVAIILESSLDKRKCLKKRVKKLYGMRSAVSHGGRKEILDIDIMSLTCIAWLLTKQMVEWRDKFHDRESLLGWIEDRKLA